jgi:hypothetical protein
MASGTVTKAAADEKFYIGLKYRPPDLNVGETIISADATASPAGLTLGAVIIMENEVTVLVSGGTAGTEYLVQFKITTSIGNVFKNPEKDAINVKVI